ncbi:RNA exonuclease 1 homolog [Ostrinia nubilalis]|uniref:RNA exonuclease 1 homolog n=1 Tax=Ostrinia nubilalis TaxID=29057 RepID=UPI0030824CA7
MLPSTGYFKGINCPFYDSGLCERPYCHFRHVRKESQNGANEESGAILQKLVSAAVQKVLQQTDASGTVSPQEVLPLDPAADIIKTGIQQTVSKVTYNPTPISELNKITNIDSENKDDINEQRKRHIPVPYTPRKPISLPVRRPLDTNGASKPFIYIPPPVKYTPGSTDSAPVDPYTPKGGIDSTEKYLPGSEVELQEYKPNENTQPTTTKHNYVPSDRSVNKKKILEYKPTKVSTKNESSTVTYQPTPRSLAPCFSSDEESEPDNKKRKMSSEFNGLDDLGPEFDILDQILDEEKTENPQVQDLKRNKQELKDDTKLSSKPKESLKVSKSESKKQSSRHESKNNSKHESKNDSKHESKNDSKHESKNDSKHESKNDSKHERKHDSKHEKKYDKDKNTDTSKHDKEKLKSRSEDKKSSSSKDGSRSSSKDHKTKEHKSRDDKKDKHSSDNKKHSSTKVSHESSKDKNRSKSTEKHSKHSSSSKNETKHKDKSEHHKSHKRSKESKERSKKKKKKDKESVSNNGWADSDNSHNESIELNDEDLCDISDSDEESRTLECKRIFEEYVPTPITQPVEETTKVEDNNEDEYVPSKKRISRTVEKNVKVIPKPPVKPDYKLNAAQAMAERLAKVKEYHASKIKTETQVEDSNKVDIRKNILGVPNISSSKIRIAHVPYASTLMNAKKNISPITNVKSEPSTSSTIAQTVKKGSQRVSHVPNEKFIDRPGVLEPLGSKIPANIRSTYLNMMIDDCLKIYLSATDAYARAQHEELTTSKKCTTVPIYKNSAVMTVSRLRKELQECNGIKKTGLDCSTLQKLPQNVSGQSSNSGSWSIENKNRRVVESQEFHGAKLYTNIQKWILSEEQLQENGFPRPHPNQNKGRAIIYGQNKQTPPKGFVRTCCRCKKDFTVDKKGFPCIKEECIYHPNRKYRVRGEVKYQCCSQDGMSDGCCIAPCHVYEYVDFENLKGFVKTLPPEKEMEDYGVYSLDCEMCYTTHGLDLTRVTVINSKCKVIYETLVKPLHPIIDYNTRYSGITEEQMAEVKTTLLEVQATLLAMFNSKTILIGHSLESDFKALKLIHDTVIDTSVLYPHKMGPPYKRALRNLSSEHLKKIIQNSVDGHDSAEDATVCMELIHYKLKEDLKTR